MLTFIKPDFESSQEIEELILLNKDFNKIFFNLNLNNENFEFLNKFLNQQSIKNEATKSNKHYYFIINSSTKEKIGFIKFQFIKDRLNIFKLFIKKENRNLTNKNDIIDFVKNFAKENNLQKISLQIPNEKKDLIEKFYTWGFKNIKEICIYLGGNLYIYGRELITEID